MRQGVVQAEDHRASLRRRLGIHHAHLGATHAEGERHSGCEGMLEERGAVSSAGERGVGDHTQHRVVGLAEDSRSGHIPGEGVLDTGGLHAQRPGDDRARIGRGLISHIQSPLAERTLAVQRGQAAAGPEAPRERSKGTNVRHEHRRLVIEDEPADVRAG